MTPEVTRNTLMYRTLRGLEHRGVVAANDAFLLVFAGAFDMDVFRELDYSSATLTNLNPDELQAAEPNEETEANRPTDATKLPYPDSSYDHVVAHAGLHHTSRPHQALCEMYRVARRTVIFFESQDSWLMRFAIAMGLSDLYEINANLLQGAPGGVDGERIPNHVYRWTRREVEKVVRSLDPAYTPSLEFVREWHIAPQIERLLSRSPARFIPVGARRGIAAAANTVVNAVASSQANSMAVIIRKAEHRLQPWMEETANGPVLNLDQATKRWRGRQG